MPVQIGKQARNRPPVSRKSGTTRKAGSAAAKNKPDVDENPADPPPDPKTSIPKGLHPALGPLLDDLIRDGLTWTPQKRARWKATWDQTLDYAYPEQAPEGQ